MRRAVLPAAVAAAALVGAAPASAHPLGNFSINHLAVVTIDRDAVGVRWILDQAEIPTFQERGLAPAVVLGRKRAVAQAGLTLTVGGRRVALRALGPGRIAFPPGAGGLICTSCTDRTGVSSSP